MSNFFVRGSIVWGILNSWWIILTFVPFGLTSFIAFLYVGFKAKELQWKILGCAYLSLVIVFFNVPLTDIWLAVFLLSWIFSVIYAFKIRSIYLGYLQGLNTNIKTSPTRFRQYREVQNLNLTERDGSHLLHKKSDQFKTFIRRFPSVFLILLTLICIHILTNINGNGSADIDTALRFGAIKSGDTSPEQWIRLASYIFVQMGGTIHLLVYMVAILILAPPLERIYGSIKFPLLFLVTGIIGGYFILTSSVGEVSGSVAGSIYGLMGLHIGLLLKKNRMVHSENKRLIWAGMIGIILFTFINPSLPISAHLGGFFSGLILSFLVTQQSFKQLTKTNWHLAIFQTVMASVIVFLLLGLPRYMPEVSSSFVNFSKSWDSSITKQASVNEDGDKDETENQTKTVEDNLTENKDIMKKNKAEENIGHSDYDQAITYLNEGKPELAIKQFKKVSKKSDKYKDAQEQIKTVERNLYLEGTSEVNYKELQKSPESYKGVAIHLYGKIYNIQEVNGKTILTLSTTQDNYGVNIGEEALILFPKATPLNEGDYIHIYGEMLGNYSKNNQKISNYLKSDQYTIYFDQRTFIEQAPVLKTKIIVDLNGNMYE